MSKSEGPEEEEEEEGTEGTLSLEDPDISFPMT